mgnify:FL=1
MNRNKKHVVFGLMFPLLLVGILHAGAGIQRRGHSVPGAPGAAGAAGDAGAQGPAGPASSVGILSTSTLSLGGGGVFLSTFQPISTTVTRITKGTFTIVGVDAFLVTPSTVGATKFKVWVASDTNFSNCWSTVTPQIVIGTQATGGSLPNTFSTYISTQYVIYDGYYLGVGVDTFSVTGTVPQDYQVNIHGRKDSSGVTW